MFMATVYEWLIQSGYVSAGVLAALFVALFALERAFPLRKRTRPFSRRLLANSVITVVAFTIGALMVQPAAAAVMSWPAKVALWTNAYNALTLKAIIDHYPIKPGLISGIAYPDDSIRQIPGVWDRLEFLVMDRRVTLNEIEHEILRPQFNEPRIHVALGCAAMGCPPLRPEPFTGERLDEQLDDQTRRFLGNPRQFRIDRERGVVYLSSIFQWFGEDFIPTYAPQEGFAGHSDKERTSLNFVSGYLPPEQAEYLRTGDYRIEYLDYDWSLNEQFSGGG